MTLKLDTPQARIWQTEVWLAEMRRSLRRNQNLRMIENRWVTTESSFVEMAWFDACVDPDARPLVIDRTMPVWIGVDASVKRDSTAIVAVAWDSRANKVRLVSHRVFQPSAGDPLDFEATIERTVRDLCARFHVRDVRARPSQERSLRRSSPMNASGLQAAGAELRVSPRLSVRRSDSTPLARPRSADLHKDPKVGHIPSFFFSQHVHIVVRASSDYRVTAAP